MPHKLSPEAIEETDMLKKGVRELKDNIERAREEQAELPTPKKKRGRPKGAKNKNPK
jgi:hypothetical protein